MEAKKDQLRKRLASASERTVPVTMTFERDGEVFTVTYDMPSSEFEGAARWMNNGDARESTGVTEVLIGGGSR